MSKCSSLPDDWNWYLFDRYYGDDDLVDDNEVESPDDYADYLRDKHEGPETFWPLLET